MGLKCDQDIGRSAEELTNRRTPILSGSNFSLFDHIDVQTEIHSFLKFGGKVRTKHLLQLIMSHFAKEFHVDIILWESLLMPVCLGFG